MKEDENNNSFQAEAVVKAAETATSEKKNAEESVSKINKEQ